MKLTIIGTGYVGLVTGTGFANLGNDVVCLDVDANKIASLEKGDVPIFEPGLEEWFRRNIKSKRLTFTTNTMDAVQSSDIILICVGTPSDPGKAADLSAVKDVAAAIGKHMNDYKVIVNKSTVPVGTAELVTNIIKENQTSDIPFDVVSNPEFLREGAAVKDFENPDRIIIGVDSDRAREMMGSLYRSMGRIGRPIMFTDIKSAEIIKYASNAMLATRISFMNQIGFLCEKTGANIKEVAKGLGLDNRIGPRFLQAGIGYGGSCFPKDVTALVSTLKEFDCDCDLFEAVHRINENQKTLAVEKLAEVLEIKDSRVGLWGISFKPKTDDIREAPSLHIARELQRRGAKVHAYDPVAIESAKKELADVEYFDNPYESVRDCDALILVTEWDEFRNVDMRAVKVLLKQQIVIDGRNIWDQKEMEELGFTYRSIGR